MKRPKEILSILDVIGQIDSEAEAHVDCPAEANGAWWIDATLQGVEITFSWSPSVGFGFFTNEGNAYEDRPNELYNNFAMAGRRILQIVKSRKEGKSASLGLAELRKLLDVSQEEVARRSNVKQSAISRVEGRSNLELETLSSFVGALGLEVRVQVTAPGITANIEPGERNVFAAPRGRSKLPWRGPKAPGTEQSVTARSSKTVVVAKHSKSTAQKKTRSAGRAKDARRTTQTGKHAG